MKKKGLIWGRVEYKEIKKAPLEVYVKKDGQKGAAKSQHTIEIISIQDFPFVTTPWQPLPLFYQYFFQGMIGLSEKKREVNFYFFAYILWQGRCLYLRVRREIKNQYIY